MEFLKQLGGNFIRALIVILLVLVVAAYFVAIVSMLIGLTSAIGDDQYDNAALIAILCTFWTAMGIALGVTLKEELE